MEPMLEQLERGTYSKGRHCLMLNQRSKGLTLSLLIQVGGIEGNSYNP